MATRQYDPLMQQLDRARVKKGMSLTAWADLAGVPRATIYRALETNPKRSVGLQYVHRMAEALGMQLTIEQIPNPLD